MFSNISNIVECRALIKITVFILLLYIVMISTTMFEKPEESNHPSNQASKPDMENKTTKILLLAYARSGSSFTGELLSADDNAAYFFEPFYVFTYNVTKSFVKNTMESIFGCADQTISNLKNNKWQPNRVKPTPSQCRASNPRVVKEIHIHRANLEPWIYESDIKVVHLIRDPRGMLNSRAARPRGIWEDGLMDASFQCNTILDDIKLEETLPSDRYYRVRYEDLALNTVSTLRKIYNFLGLELTTSVNRKVEVHIHAENKDNLAVLSDAEKKRTGVIYYNTFKTSSFDPNSWRKKLTIEKIRDIEGSCKDLMAIAGYQKFEHVTS